MTHYVFKAIGTSWKIDIYDALGTLLGPAREAEILTLIRTRIEAFEQTYSRFRADSLVSKMSREAGVYTLPADATSMFALYRDLYDRTGGFFTPLVGKMLVDAGYDAQYSLKQKQALVAPPAWDDVMEFSVAPQGSPTLTIKKPVSLDFGAAGKGYLIDLVGQVLDEQGISGYCIDAGGDILHKGEPTSRASMTASAPLRVGLEDPEHTDQVIGVCELQDASICGSAGNRRSWGDFTHIMNPKTLVSPTEIIAVWVVAKTALIADALTTCLFFVPAATLRAYDFEYVILKKDRSIEKSAHFTGELFVTGVTTSNSATD